MCWSSRGGAGQGVGRGVRGGRRPVRAAGRRERGGLGRRRRRRQGRLREDRRARQQRGHPALQRAGQHPAGRVRAGGAGQHDGRVPRDTRRRARDRGRGRRDDRQHVLVHRSDRHAPGRRVRRDQARGAGAHQGRRHGAGGEGRPGQRRLSGGRRHRDDQPGPAGRGRRSGDVRRGPGRVLPQARADGADRQARGGRRAGPVPVLGRLLVHHRPAVRHRRGWLAGVSPF